jgi:hypothetical protein
MRLLRSSLALAAFAAALAATAAPALGATAPEGSALDQYQEDVPGAGHDRSTRETLEGSPVPLPPQAQQALEQLGPSGDKTLALAEQTAPADANHGGNHRAPSEHGGGGFSGVVTQLLDPSGSGIGWVLPLILAATAIAGIGFALSRRRRAGPAETA